PSRVSFSRFFRTSSSSMACSLDSCSCASIAVALASHLSSFVSMASLISLIFDIGFSPEDFICKAVLPPPRDLMTYLGVLTTPKPPLWPNLPSLGIFLGARVDSHLRNRRHPNWDGEEKRRAFTRLGFDPNPSPMVLDDFLASGQSYPGSGTIRARIYPLKNAKDFVEIGWCDSNSVVSDGKPPLVPFQRCSDMNLRRLITSKLDCVAHKVLK